MRLHDLSANAIHCCLNPKPRLDTNQHQIKAIGKAIHNGLFTAIGFGADDEIRKEKASQSQC